MNIHEFVEQLQEELEFETKLSLDTYIKELEEWDSLSAMVLIGFVSQKFKLIITAKDIESFTSLHSIVDFIGIDKFD